METRPKAERRLSLSAAQRERPGRLLEGVKVAAAVVTAAESRGVVGVAASQVLKPVR